MHSQRRVLASRTARVEPCRRAWSIQSRIREENIEVIRRVKRVEMSPVRAERRPGALQSERIRRQGTGLGEYNPSGLGVCTVRGDVNGVRRPGQQDNAVIEKSVGQRPPVHRRQGEHAGQAEGRWLVRRGLAVAAGGYTKEDRRHESA